MTTKSDAGSSEATFIFKGTVKKLKAATMRAVPVDERTAVVHIEQVIEAPKNLGRTAGHNITVQLAGRARVEPGQQFVFHTVGWIFGDGIAMRALAQEPVGKRHKALLERGGEPGNHYLSRQLQKRVDVADLVISGQVVSVHLPADGAMATHDLATMPLTRRPVSEHDPKWREAVVAVNDLHKGRHEGQQVNVLFPASHDVRWFRSPKFEAGQKGYFMLHKGRMKPSEKAGTATRFMAPVGGPDKEAEVDVFTALHPQDFQPLAQPDMRAAIGKKEQ